MSDYTPLLVAALFAASAFIVSMNRGIVGLLASGLAVALGAGALLLVFSALPTWAWTSLEVALPWRLTLGIGGALGFAIFVVSRLSLGAMLKRLFNPDGPLHRCADGLAGGILSLLPSAIAVFLLFTFVRAAGTVRELNYVAGLAREGVGEMGGRLPDYPRLARWRNAVESLPRLAPLLDATDPFSRREARHAAALVLAQGGPELRAYLRDASTSRALAAEPVWRELVASPDLADSVAALDQIALVTDPAVQAAAAEPARREDLRNLPLQELLEGFLASIPPAPDVGASPATP